MLKDSNLKIAVVIPVYNCHDFIGDCLESLIAQKYQNWRAYCIDDGSTDGSSRIMDEYEKKDSRILVFHKDNGGVASARNYALDRLSDEHWISFLDADDYVSPNMYEDIVKSLSNHSNEAVDYIRLFPSKTNLRYSEYIKCSKSNINEGNERVVTTVGYFEKENVGGFAASVIVKASLVNRYHFRFIETMRVLEDQVFSITCAARAKMIMIYKRECYYYYHNPLSATVSKIDRSNDIIQCINHIRNVAEEANNRGLDYFYRTRFVPIKAHGLLNERIRHLSSLPAYRLYESFRPADYKLSVVDRIKYYTLKVIKKL